MSDQHDYDKKYEISEFADDLPLPPPPEWLPRIVTKTEGVDSKYFTIKTTVAVLIVY